MCSLIDICILCTKDYKCVSVDERIITQIKYVLPEITIIKLGIPLRICSVCDGALCAFNKFKQSSVESSRRLEARIKGAQGPPLHTASPRVVDDSETSGAKPEKMEEIFIKEEYVEETPLDTQMHTNRAFLNPIDLVETVIAEPHNQLHKDRLSQNIQLHTNTNADNIEVFIKQEQKEETPQGSEFYNNILKEECVSNSVNDGTVRQPDHNTEDESATFNTNEEVWEESFVDSEEETVEETDGNSLKNIQIINQDEFKKEHRCNICTDTELFPCKALLVRHMKKNHWRIKVLSCTVCKKIFVHKYDLNKHMELHNKIKNFPCSICKKMFFNKRNLQEHIKLHNEEQESESHATIQIQHSFSCSVCNKIFKSKTLLNCHMITHSEIKDYRCDTCAKTFKRKNELKRHMQIHLEIKTFPCETCNKSFKRKDHLIRHMKHHSGVKDFRCEICNKSFIQKPHLNNHMKIHLGVKDYQCQTCNKSFTQSVHLSNHIKTHSEEKDFSCDVCSKSFKRKDNLMYHMKIHSGIKDFSCEICGKSFKGKGYLVRHMNSCNV